MKGIQEAGRSGDSLEPRDTRYQTNAAAGRCRIRRSVPRLRCPTTFQRLTLTRGWSVTTTESKEQSGRPPHLRPAGFESACAASQWRPVQRPGGPSSRLREGRESACEWDWSQDRSWSNDKRGRPTCRAELSDAKNAHGRWTQPSCARMTSMPRTHPAVHRARIRAPGSDLIPAATTRSYHGEIHHGEAEPRRRHGENRMASGAGLLDSA